MLLTCAVWLQRIHQPSDPCTRHLMQLLFKRGCHSMICSPSSPCCLMMRSWACPHPTLQVSTGLQCTPKALPAHISQVGHAFSVRVCHRFHMV